MKKTYFWQTALMAGALLFGFTACSSDDNEAQQQNNNQERTLTIALNLAQPQVMRSVATTDPKDATPNESAINDVIVAIFDGSGNTVKIEKVTSTQTSDPVPGLSGVYKWNTTTTGPKITMAAQGLATDYDVYVVANAPSAVATDLQACASETAFETVTITAEQTLSSDPTTDADGKSTNLIMLGKGKLADGSTTTFASTISLYRLVSKIYIEEASADFSGSVIYENASYKITEIYLDNVPASQKFVLDENTTAPTINMNAGTDPSTTTSSKKYLTTGALTGTDQITLTTTPTPINHFFFAMPNASSIYTRLVVKGEFTPSTGATSTTIYYPIYLNWTWNETASQWEAVTLTPNTLPYKTSVTRAAKKIYANDAYKITLNIKTIGVTDPKQDLDPQSVEVNVSVANWVDVAQNSTFQ